ncbi:MAG: hypothetical protein EAX96_08210 [Candidatus Lokiarchaeota archaeon]|nr:hypothetical protein [Candidatus Lokiarchaeota archaeon]
MQIIEPYLELAGIVLLTIIGIFYIIISLKLFKSWKLKQLRSTMIFAIGFLFASLGLFGLTAEKIFLAYIYPHPIGDVFGRLSAIIGIVMSIGALLSLNAFTLEMALEKHKKKAFPPITVIGIIPTTILIYAISTYIAIIDNHEFVYPFWITLIMVCMIFPVMIFPPIVFFYYSIKIRKVDKANYKRSITMGIAMLTLAITYTIELAGASLILAILFRLGFFIFAILMYVSIELPDWYRKLIGWSEE